MTKTICLFCGKSHRKRPKLCLAKDEIMNSLVRTMPMSQAMRAVESGLVDLEGHAVRLLQKRKKGN